MVGQPMRYGTLVAGLAAALLAIGGIAQLATGEAQTGGGAPAPESAAVDPMLSVATSTAPEVPAGVDARVTRVIDGSTLDAVVAGVRTAVGYIGAAPPPGNTPCGRAATARNAELAGTAVRLETDPAYEQDSAGRKLYYAYTTEGELIEAVLVREGLARAAGVDGRHGAELAAADAAAQTAGSGCLWNEKPAT
jgi:endonuclease YncB( thermonuclease family)